MHCWKVQPITARFSKVSCQNCFSKNGISGIGSFCCFIRCLESKKGYFMIQSGHIKKECRYGRHVLFFLSQLCTEHCHTRTLDLWRSDVAMIARHAVQETIYGFNASPSPLFETIFRLGLLSLPDLRVRISSRLEYLILFWTALKIAWISVQGLCEHGPLNISTQVLFPLASYISYSVPLSDLK